MQVAFLYLDAFSGIGGIQTFNRNFLLACSKIADNHNVKFASVSYKDNSEDFPALNSIQTQTALGNKVRFQLKALLCAFRADKVVIGHFNLLFPLVLLLKLKPKTEIVVIAHGVEAWKPLPYWKRFCLRKCNTILAVSRFTRNRILEIHGIKAGKVQLFPNTIHESFSKSVNPQRVIDILHKWNLNGQEKILFTLCRLSAKEKQKGYERVINLLPVLKEKFPSIKYILAGKEEDVEELARIRHLIQELGVEDQVILAGYLQDEELPLYYHLCDAFVMPSLKEGFGIVFLEALSHGKIVIAGNQDGSKDALCDGKLGILVDPTSENEILCAITNALAGSVEESLKDADVLKQAVYHEFGFPAFLGRTGQVILGSFKANPKLN